MFYLINCSNICDQVNLNQGRPVRVKHDAYHGQNKGKAKNVN